MDGLFTLLTLSLLMGVASFVVGSLPLSFSLSSSQLRLVSALGMGVLIGTSLIVIIPEGVETLYSSESVALHNHRKRDTTTQGIDVRWEYPSRPSLIIPRDGRDNVESNLPVSSGFLDPLDSLAADPKKRDEDETAPEKEDESHKEEGQNGGRSPHAWIGVGLISGFLLMYLIDQLPQFARLPSTQQQQPHHISLDNLASGLGRSSSPARTGFLDFNGSSPRRNQGVATTVGLVIHAAADGIALSASTSSTSLSFIIFMAIMVHKAPASFGLTTALLKQGVTTRAARTHLLIFSLAAPVGAILTWVVAHTVMAGHVGDEQGTRWNTGMLLLFSGGTFLYVAIHTMQDNSMESTHRDANSAGLETREPQRTKKSMRDLVASVVGMLLPLFLQIGHAH